MSANTDAAAIVDQLEHEHLASVDALRSALRTFLQGGPPPSLEARKSGIFTYPELRLTLQTAEPIDTLDELIEVELTGTEKPEPEPPRLTAAALSTSPTTY